MGTGEAQIVCPWRGPHPGSLPKDLVPGIPRWEGRSEGFPSQPSVRLFLAEGGGVVGSESPSSLCSLPRGVGLACSPQLLNLCLLPRHPLPRSLSLQWEPGQRRGGRLRAALQAPLGRNLHRQLQPLPETNGCQEILGGGPREKV